MIPSTEDCIAILSTEDCMVIPFTRDCSVIPFTESYIVIPSIEPAAQHQRTKEILVWRYNIHWSCGLGLPWSFLLHRITLRFLLQSMALSWSVAVSPST